MHIHSKPEGEPQMIASNRSRRATLKARTTTNRAAARLALAA